MQLKAMFPKLTAQFCEDIADLWNVHKFSKKYQVWERHLQRPYYHGRLTNRLPLFWSQFFPPDYSFKYESE